MKHTKIITMLILILFILSIMFIGGCKLIKQADPCEREYTECVHNCGEGLLSSLCKEKCTYDRSECQKSN